MLGGCGNNSSRGNPSLWPSTSPLPPRVSPPPLPHCFPLEPITLATQKYTRSGELRRVLGVSLGNGPTSDDHLAGLLKPPPPPVASEELKSFKDSVQDASRKARDRAKMLRESIFKLDKYRAALVSSKKRQRSDILSNQKSSGANLSRLGSQILRNAGDQATPRNEDKARAGGGVGMKKRIRSSLVDLQADGQSTVISGHQIVTQKDRDVQKDGFGGKIQIEEKIRRSPAGGEGWEKKMRRKRSFGALGGRATNGDREMKQAMHPKQVMHPRPSVDTKLRSCDALGFRLRSSPALSEAAKLDESFEPASSKDCTSPKTEMQSFPPPRDRSSILEERVSAKGNKLSIHEEKPAGTPSTMTKGKFSRAQRTGSIMNLGSSPQCPPSSGVLEDSELPTTENKVPPLGMTINHKRPISAGSSAHPVAQWVGQRPNKISRTRRANLVSPVMNSDEDNTSSQGFAASDMSSRCSSHGTSRSLLATSVENNNPKLKMKLESTPSPIGLSEGEETGCRQTKFKGNAVDTGEVTINADHKGRPSMSHSRKNKILVKEETGDDVHVQGRVGRFLSSNKPAVSPIREKVEKLRTAKHLQSTRRGSDNNKSKSGRPSLKKLKDRKTPISSGIVLNSSSDFPGESGDDREELLAAANSACNASHLASAGPFWKKMEYIFACVSSNDASYLRQQLSFAEELTGSLSQMFGDEYNTWGDLLHKEVPFSSGSRNGSCSNQGPSKMDAFCERVDMGKRLDKVPSLFQRVLSALIEEDGSEEFYHQNEGRNMSFQCASDDSHCGSCNHIGFELKDRDRMESEVESEVDLQTPKHCCLDGFSCNKSASSNTYSNRSVSSSLCNNEQWQADDGLSQLDGALVTRNDLSVPHASQTNVTDIFSFDGQYQMMSFDDRLLLELQSIGLYPETMPDLAEGKEGINHDLMELQGNRLQQVERLKKHLEKIDSTIQYARELQRQDIEQVAMNELVVMAYRKRTGCRGGHSSKSVVRKVSKEVALAFAKRTLARCHQFEDTGRSCFREPPLQDILFSAFSFNNDPKSADRVGSGTGSNTQGCNHKAEANSSAIKRHGSQFDNIDRYSEGGLFEQEPILNKGKKREVLLEDVGGASSKISPIGSKPQNEVEGKKTERDGDENREMLTTNSVSGSGRPSLGNVRSERKSKAKPKLKTNHLSTLGNGLPGRFIDVKDSALLSKTEVGGSSPSAADIGNESRQLRLPSSVVTPQDSSREKAEEPIGFGNLQMNELDSIELGVANDDLGGNQDLSSWLNFDEDGLQDHDSIGLEIPMDDLSELNMLM